MEEVFVDISEHASGCLEGMIGCLESSVFVSVLICSMAGQNGGDVEDDGGFLVGQRVLCGGFVGECIEPGQ